MIKQYCVNLNELVERDKIDGIIGRERETLEIIRALGRKKKNNVILVGGEGVGKTAIAENIAYLIVNGQVPSFMLKKKLISLDMTALIAGTTLRGMFEERVKGILDEVKNDGNYILMIDNIGVALSDRQKNDYDISAMLSTSLENGDCQIIGTCDFSSYRKTFDKDPSLARRFKKIIVDAPTKEESFNIIRSVKNTYEKFHCVKYNEDAVDACVELSSKYITDRNLPDSAIDILDEVGSMVGTVTDDSELSAKISEINLHKKNLVNLKNSDNYKEYDKEYELIEKLTKDYNTMLSKRDEDRKNNPKTVTIDDVLNIVSSKTNIPINQLNSNDKNKLLLMNERIKSEVIGQDEAIDTICKAIKRNRIGLSKNGSGFSMMSIGKTGVGKTLIAKKIAKELFGTEKALVRFDMSEYPDKTSVNKLIGSNPGYVGYEDGGVLTETVKNKKYCVLLFDEIEKADPEVYNVFLQVLDEGFLTDNSGQKVDFSNTIIIFTSNVGAKAANDFKRGIDFVNNEEENTKKILSKQLKNRFPPEFLNRIDNIVYFNSLNDEDLKKIIKIELNKTNDRLLKIGYGFTYDEPSVNFILSTISKERDFGARPIMRSIRDNIEDKITDMILENIENGHVFEITCKDNNLHIS